jgi:hypothetical protein
MKMSQKMASGVVSRNIRIPRKDFLCGINNVAGSLKSVAEKFLHDGVVVNDENSRHVWISRVAAVARSIQLCP